ncbi:putative UDP-3-O-(3-hydroxymyristoyl) glucosamine N-acyltransferase [uncultured spirochete]|uniref:Putative UDP-3-O-(3-hydroxymyristoyl) glucosamine N-acyltransferase n=1 Tax=uncultured spirochete TaxID=156406 RepID=A0A3P3XS48_9SPIR|nr:putative UDP-3-O-(3-hydroxymyristoyl) glucosamine N-acyltransferase [uncultured spirochete]
MISCELSKEVLQQVTGLLIPREGDFKYHHICSFDECYDNSIYFLGKKINGINLLCKNAEDSIYFVEKTVSFNNASSDSIIIYVENVRNIMMKILLYLEEGTLDDFIDEDYYITDKKSKIHKTAVVDNNTAIGSEVIIGPHVYIGRNVAIGDNTRIFSGVKIVRNVSIGKNCLIRENSVIGGGGFGIEKDESGNNIHIPQLGGVVIGDYVEIGALNTVCSGTIKPTYVGNYVKTDDHIHIAHNDLIEDNTSITAGVIISGSVIIKQGSWIGINSSIKQGVKIGENSLIGMAACVNKDVQEGTTVIGNPAKEISEFIKVQNKINSIL